jgi:class 3 adenylate cyclase
MAVHVAARVCAEAAIDDLVVTDTVATLLVGVTGTPPFESAREVPLKGVPGRWRLHRAVLAGERAGGRSHGGVARN